MKRADFLAQVAKAANKAQRRRRRVRVVAETSLDALAEAREADPMRGIRAARQVARCGKIKRSDGQPCRAPRVRGASRCRWHGGLRQVPHHPGNIRRLVNGTYAAQVAYRLSMKSLGQYWRQLSLEENRFLRGVLTAEEWSDMHLVDRAARALLEARECGWAWKVFLRNLRAERKLRRQ